MATEETKYVVILKEDAFEIRQYPERVAAEVNVEGDHEQAARTGFGLLASYIFGGNTSGQKIAMTAPVLQQEESESWLIRFPMPSAYSLKTLPDPNDARVRVVSVPASRYAVVRFSGKVSPEIRESQSVALRAFILKHGLVESGRPSLAQYNPPWTPGFLRRNEILIALSSGHS
jgi:SOUL heme-binding protein